MAIPGNKIIVQMPDTGLKEVKPILLDLAAREIGDVSDLLSPSLALDQSEKRWLVVGVCMNKIINPLLRDHVDSKLKNLYTSLQASHSIDKQDFQHHLKKYPSKHGKMLIYGNINNNKKNTTAFNYNICSHIDFAKLFLLSNLAKFTAFDETCDASALLGLISNIGGKCFDAILRKEAETMRSKIRNPWAHCNFADWDELKYMQSFQTMDSVIQNLQLPKDKESAAITELRDWETKGLKIILGSCTDVKILTELKEETSALAKYVLTTQSIQQDEVRSITEHLEILDKQMERLQISIQTSVQRPELEDVRKDVKDLSLDQEQLEGEVRQIQKQFEEDFANLTERVDEVYRKHDKLCEEVKTLKTGPNKRLYGESETFMTPSRVPHFTGRTSELRQLKDKLAAMNEHRIMSICGLGGCGKTSLAIEYSWLFQSFYPGGVFWISAESNDTFANSVNQLSREVGISGKDFTEIYEQILNWLATLESRWLLVMDNMDQYEVSDNIMKMLQEPWRRNCKGHLLVTTRRDVVEMTEICPAALKSEDCLKIHCLSIDESVSFMFRRTEKGTFEDQEAVTTLATELGGLPLALEQAAAYIKRLNCSFAEYLEQFRIQRLKLLKKRITSASSMSKERLTVSTTWSMNFEYVAEMSEEEGYGNAAAFIMEVSAFLSPDDIPIQAINSGSPAVSDNDVEETLNLPLGRKQILEILTRFSLFQSYGKETYSVHRLVQEVIRGQLDRETTSERLTTGIRMLHKAIKETPTPTKILYSGRSTGTANDLSRLHLWGKLASQICTLTEHIEKFVNDKNASAGDYINLEMATILHEASIYHSVNRRHAKALDLQNKKTGILAAVHDLDNSILSELTTIKIPLNIRDQSKIQNSMKSAEEIGLGKKTAGIGIGISENKTSVDDLREHGNNSFKDGNLHDAIKWYTNAICMNESDPRLFSNRSLCYLKLNDLERALKDADQSIALDRGQYKPHARRAYALYGLAKQTSPGSKKIFLECSGHAAASTAANLHPPCNLEYQMKIDYPILVFKEIRNDNQLLKALMSKFTQPKTTLLLHPGEYRFALASYQDVQIVGIKKGVTLNCFPERLTLPDDVEPFNCHFENVTFTGVSLLFKSKGQTCSFYDCTFSTGIPACDDFPNCFGGPGCRSPSICSEEKPKDLVGYFNHSFRSKLHGTGGIPGLQICSSSTAYVNHCSFDRCGGGGVLVDGKDSVAYLHHCIVRRNRQAGLEVRNQGRMYVENCEIYGNQLHGIGVGPEAEYCYINDNRITGNHKEGIWINGSSVIILNNDIGQNYAGGISVDHLNKVAVKGNRIYDNFHWGLLIQGGSSAFVQANEIFSNKCGGIQIRHNGTARVFIDANTVRAHTGPALYITPDDELVQQNRPLVTEHLRKDSSLFDGRSYDIQSAFQNSSPPILTNRNTILQNDMGQQHPKEKSKSLFQVCSYCYGRPSGTGKLLRCSDCKHAHYCSVKCSKLYWPRHKNFCRLLQGHNFVTVEIPRVMDNEVSIRSINPGLESVGNTPPPKRGEVFIVKIQGGIDLVTYNPNIPVCVYDRSMVIDFFFVHPEIYQLVMECGVLGQTMFSSKKIFCYASYAEKGRSIRIQTNVLAPFQKW